jgi:hypothetical protein
MSRMKPKLKSKSKARPPNLPQHDLPDPYSRLLTLGEGDFESIYDTVANTLKAGNAASAVHRLVQMVQDETYYDYDEEFVESANEDPRGWTRLHALRVLIRMGDAAQAGIEPLLPLLNDEDDYLREEIPFYYAAMGQPAIEPLTRILRDMKAETYLRAGAGESLAEIGEKVPELRPVIIPILEDALLGEKEDSAFAAFLIINLLDLGSQDSLPIIEQAFEEERVDEMIVCMADVQEHFGLPVLARRPEWDYPEPEEERAGGREAGLFSDMDETEETASQPYVAPEKIGRNEPCPCGSGKKYKKCCGAAV